MNILARQNIFQVRKSPEIKRKNYLLQTASTQRPQSKDVGISNSRTHSIQFDRLYNPYRLMQLGASQHSSASYKSMDSKKCMKLSLINLKTVTLGNNIDKNKMSAAEKQFISFKQYLKKTEISEICPCNDQKQSSQLQILKFSQQFYQLGEITEDMFGNMEEITSKETSFLSFDSINRQPTIFYSLISHNEI